MEGRMLGMVFVLFMFCFVVGGVFGELSYDYYEMSCPPVESIVRGTLAPIFLQDPTTPASLLRLMFHDCQVQGCDASILLDSNASEMVSAKNYAIRHRETIGAIKSMLELECPRQVSCADILILAAREAVAMSGGPQIRVPLGRRDSTNTSYKHADASLPSSNIGVDDLLHIFSRKGFTIDESVAILGAHTLGVTHCFSVLDRLGQQRRDTMPSPFLTSACPLGSLAANTTFVANDFTLLTFDNRYFQDAMGGRGVLRIDADMATDPRTSPIVAQFALNQAQFFETFRSAFVKLSHSGVLIGNKGVVRKRCDAVN